MTRASTQVTSLGLTAVCLACWFLTFAAGHDIWHDTGRLDVRALGATPTDVRAFTTGFYGLFFVLVAQFAMATIGVVRARRLSATE